MLSYDSTPRILLTGTAADGDRIDLVAYDDTACGIYRNGLPVPGQQWDPCRLDESTDALMRALSLE
jgi:hypothetical protein